MIDVKQKRKIQNAITILAQCKQNNCKFVLPEKHEIENIMLRSRKNIEQMFIDVDLYDKEEFLFVVNKLGYKVLFRRKYKAFD